MSYKQLMDGIVNCFPAQKNALNELYKQLERSDAAGSHAADQLLAAARAGVVRLCGKGADFKAAQWLVTWHQRHRAHAQRAASGSPALQGAASSQQQQQQAAPSGSQVAFNPHLHSSQPLAPALVAPPQPLSASAQQQQEQQQQQKRLSVSQHEERDAKKAKPAAGTKRKEDK